MTDAEGVVFTLVTRRKGRQPIFKLDSSQLFSPAGQHLVWIRLVSHIPKKAIIRSLINIVQGDGKFHRTESRGKVPSLLTYRVDKVTPQLCRDALKHAERQPSQIVW